MEFKNGATATVTMVAFTEAICTRKVSISIQDKYNLEKILIFFTFLLI